MTIQEAMHKIRFHHWVRPVSWRGSGKAYALRVEELTTCLVPSKKGGDRAPFPHPDEVCGEWEVVDEDIVLMESR